MGTLGIIVILIRDFRVELCAMLQIWEQEHLLVKVMNLLTIWSEG